MSPFDQEKQELKLMVIDLWERVKEVENNDRFKVEQLSKEKREYEYKNTDRENPRPVQIPEELREKLKEAEGTYNHKKRELDQERHDLVLMITDFWKRSKNIV